MKTLYDEKDDISWYGWLLDKDPASRFLSAEEKQNCISTCMQEAEKQQNLVRDTFGSAGPEACIEELGYQIIEEERELMPSFLYMGLTEPDDRTVRFNLTTTRLLEKYLKAQIPVDSSKVEKLRDIILYHELFHVIEEHTEGIITRRIWSESRLLGVIPVKHKVETASEIGAVHFSKLMTHADFSPCIYMCDLLAAEKQYEEMRDQI